MPLLECAQVAPPSVDLNTPLGIVGTNVPPAKVSTVPTYIVLGLIGSITMGITCTVATWIEAPGLMSCGSGSPVSDGVQCAPASKLRYTRAERYAVPTGGEPGRPAPPTTIVCSGVVQGSTCGTQDLGSSARLRTRPMPGRLGAGESRAMPVSIVAQVVPPSVLL